MPRLVVRLGKTRFGDLDETPWRIVANVGARRGWYGEVFDLGNPGYYLSYGCAVADSGYVARSRGPALPVDAEHGEWDFDLRTDPVDGDEANLQRPQVAAYRRHTRINTWAVIGGPFDPVHDPTPVRVMFGADHDHVRTLANQG